MFSRCSVRIVPFADVFLMYLWAEVSSTSVYSAVLIGAPRLLFWQHLKHSSLGTQPQIHLLCPLNLFSVLTLKSTLFFFILLWIEGGIRWKKESSPDQ